MHDIFMEAESFQDPGGWLMESQSVAEMGSAYIMAHGLGTPVADAVTEFNVEEAGEYHIYVRTRDWTAVWGRGTPAGRFTVGVDGDFFDTEMGTNGPSWAWQEAGVRRLEPGRHTLALHDLTGFNGRADAIFLSTQTIPPDDADALQAFRDGFINPTIDRDETEYDLVVVGGGIAGICTALSAQREGLHVLLINDRPVLGGCNSSEIRVCLGGRLHEPPYTNLGRLVKEIEPIMGDPNLFDKELYEDNRKRFAFMLYEAKGTAAIAQEERAVAIETEGRSIRAVVTLSMRSGRKKRYTGKLFCDCTGDAVLSRMAGCEVMYGREGKAEFNESLAAPEHENLVMGQSIRWYTEDCGRPVDFPDIDFAIPFTEQDCFHTFNGDWEQESGFRRQMATETEYIRDYGLLAIFSNWSFQKNHSARKYEYRNYRLVWASHLGGKRESYRVLGDMILTQNDIEDHIIYPDATASMTWSIDLHFPEYDCEQRFGEGFRSFAYHRGIKRPYPVPYRTLYARDCDNLFLGGRILSMTHVAFSSARVMRTLGQLGEVVGLAAKVARDHDALPRDVYERYLPELIEAMKRGCNSPDAFQCDIGEEEAYHFKDAGWFYADADEDYNTHPMIDKVRRNVRHMGVEHRDKNFLKE